MYKNCLDFYPIDELCVCAKKLIYIKPTRRINQPEHHCSTANNQVQSGPVLQGKYLTTLMETVDGDKHVQDDKHVCSIQETADKVCANHLYQCLPPTTCRNIQQLGLCRRGKRGGKRRKMHLDIIRPCTPDQNNLVRVNKVNIGKYQPDKSLAFSFLNAQSIKNKDSTIHHQIVLNKTDILLVTEMWLTSKDTDKIWLDPSDLNKEGYKFSSAIRKKIEGVVV